MMISVQVLFDHIRSVFQIRRHFKNPWIIVLLRMGIIKFPYFLHEINKGPHKYALLGRPTTTSTADLFILRDVLITEAYKDVLPLLPKKNIRFLDVGANLGSFTIWMDRHLGVSEAFCFEPEADSFRLLNFNLALNDCTTAKTVRCAIGGESRMAKIALKKSSPGGTNLYSDYSAVPDAQTIPIVALQEWLSGAEGDFDLLKMDCECSEWEIIDRTPARYFERFPVLLAEVHGDPVSNRPVGEFKRLVEALGYQTIRWDNKFHGLYIGVRN
jgi:FkbM family methyltransferase